MFIGLISLRTEQEDRKGEGMILEKHSLEKRGMGRIQSVSKRDNNTLGKKRKNSLWAGQFQATLAIEGFSNHCGNKRKNVPHTSQCSTWDNTLLHGEPTGSVLPSPSPLTAPPLGIQVSVRGNGVFKLSIGQRKLRNSDTASSGDPGIRTSGQQSPKVKPLCRLPENMAAFQLGQLHLHLRI